MSEPPQFPDTQYKATVLSIAPYRTPVITVRVNTHELSSQRFSNRPNKNAYQCCCYN